MNNQENHLEGKDLSLIFVFLLAIYLLIFYGNLN